MSRIGNFFKKIFNKGNLHKPIFWGGMIGVIGLFVFVVGGILVIAEQPAFCNTCHIMNAPHDTWVKSTHAKVRCTLCHVKPGFIEMIKHKPAGLVELWVTLTKNPEKPESVKMPANENCISCHKSQRKVSASGDLLIPHAQHTKLRGLKCVDCHRSLVHVPSKGKKNRPPMIVCYKCHDGKKAPNRCSSCHTEKSAPIEHQDSGFLLSHGEIQKQDPAYCEKCHGWVKDYCTECHQRRPQSHAGKWRTHHRDRIAALGMKNCLQCHNEQFCVRCHGIMPAAAPSG